MASTALKVCLCGSEARKCNEVPENGFTILQCVKCDTRWKYTFCAACAGTMDSRFVPKCFQCRKWLCQNPGCREYNPNRRCR